MLLGGQLRLPPEIAADDREQVGAQLVRQDFVPVAVAVGMTGVLFCFHRPQVCKMG